MQHRTSITRLTAFLAAFLWAGGAGATLMPHTLTVVSTQGSAFTVSDPFTTTFNISIEDSIFAVDGMYVHDPFDPSNPSDPVFTLFSGLSLLTIGTQSWIDLDIDVATLILGNPSFQPNFVEISGGQISKLGISAVNGHADGFNGNENGFDLFLDLAPGSPATTWGAAPLVTSIGIRGNGCGVVGLDGVFQVCAAAPEPTTLPLIALGLFALAFTLRRRRLNPVHRRHG